MFSQACVKNSVHRVEVYTPLGRLAISFWWYFGTPAEFTPAQAITSTGATVVMKDKIEMLTTPKQIKRYEKYLEKQKEKLQEDTKL